MTSNNCAIKLPKIINGDWRLTHSSLTVGSGMPRVNDEFLDSVIYFYRSEHEAVEGIRAGGSGFLVSVKAETIPNAYFFYAVTNRHVIKAADVVRLNTQEGQTYIERLSKEGWIYSATDDLAIRPVTLDADVFKFKTVPHDLILTKEQAEKHRVGIGDEVFMIGRFINHEGIQKNAPLVRFGTIAQMPSDPVSYQLDGSRHDQESIIADIRSIGGYSGSPVFLKEFSFFNRPDGGENITKHWLLGVDWGHIPMWSAVCGLNEEPNGVGQVNINSGMAGIIPSWKLFDLLMSDEMLKKRSKDEVAHKAAITSNAGAPDVAIAHLPPSTDANPTHRTGEK